MSDQGVSAGAEVQAAAPEVVAPPVGSPQMMQAETEAANTVLGGNLAVEDGREIGAPFAGYKGENKSDGGEGNVGEMGAPFAPHRSGVREVDTGKVEPGVVVQDKTQEQTGLVRAVGKQLPVGMLGAVAAMQEEIQATTKVWSGPEAVAGQGGPKMLLGGDVDEDEGGVYTGQAEGADDAEEQARMAQEAYLHAQEMAEQQRMAEDGERGSSMYGGERAGFRPLYLKERKDDWLQYYALWCKANPRSPENYRDVTLGLHIFEPGRAFSYLPGMTPRERVFLKLDESDPTKQVMGEMDFIWAKQRQMAVELTLRMILGLQIEAQIANTVIRMDNWSPIEGNYDLEVEFMHALGRLKRNSGIEDFKALPADHRIEMVLAQMVKFSEVGVYDPGGKDRDPLTGRPYKLYRGRISVNGIRDLMYTRYWAERMLTPWTKPSEGNLIHARKQGSWNRIEFMTTYLSKVMIDEDGKHLPLPIVAGEGGERDRVAARWNDDTKRMEPELDKDGKMIPWAKWEGQLIRTNEFHLHSQRRIGAVHTYARPALNKGRSVAEERSGANVQKYDLVELVWDQGVGDYVRVNEWDEMGRPTAWEEEPYERRWDPEFERQARYEKDGRGVLIDTPGAQLVRTHPDQQAGLIQQVEIDGVMDIRFATVRGAFVSRAEFFNRRRGDDWENLSLDEQNERQAAIEADWEKLRQEKRVFDPKARVMGVEYVDSKTGQPVPADHPRAVVYRPSEAVKAIKVREYVVRDGQGGEQRRYSSLEAARQEAGKHPTRVLHVEQRGPHQFAVYEVVDNQGVVVKTFGTAKAAEAMVEKTGKEKGWSVDEKPIVGIVGWEGAWVREENFYELRREEWGKGTTEKQQIDEEFKQTHQESVNEDLLNDTWGYYIDSVYGFLVVADKYERAHGYGTIWHPFSDGDPTYNALRSVFTPLDPVVYTKWLAGMHHYEWGLEMWGPIRDTVPEAMPCFTRSDVEARYENQVVIVRGGGQNPEDAFLKLDEQQREEVMKEINEAKRVVEQVVFRKPERPSGAVLWGLMAKGMLEGEAPFAPNIVYDGKAKRWVESSEPLSADNRKKLLLIIKDPNNRAHQRVTELWVKSWQAKVHGYTTDGALQMPWQRVKTNEDMLLTHVSLEEATRMGGWDFTRQFIHAGLVAGGDLDDPKTLERIKAEISKYVELHWDNVQQRCLFVDGEAKTEEFRNLAREGKGIWALMILAKEDMGMDTWEFEEVQGGKSHASWADYTVQAAGAHKAVAGFFTAIVETERVVPEEMLTAQWKAMSESYKAQAGQIEGDQLEALKRTIAALGEWKQTVGYLGDTKRYHSTLELLKGAVESVGKVKGYKDPVGTKGGGGKRWVMATKKATNTRVPYYYRNLRAFPDLVIKAMKGEGYDTTTTKDGSVVLVSPSNHPTVQVRLVADDHKALRQEIQQKHAKLIRKQNPELSAGEIATRAKGAMEAEWGKMKMGSGEVNWMKVQKGMEHARNFGQNWFKMVGAAALELQLLDQDGFDDFVRFLEEREVPKKGSILPGEARAAIDFTASSEYKNPG